MITLSQVIPEFLHSKQYVQRMSPCTIYHYRANLKRFAEFLLPDDPEFGKITSDHIQAYFETLAHMTNTSLVAVWADLSSLWTWATQEREYCTVHIMRKIKPPRPDNKAVVPFTQEEVKRLLAVLGLSKSFTRKYSPSKPYELDTLITARNKAIFMFLIDSGMREAEIRNIRIEDIQQGERGIYLIKVLGKGNKERIVAISSRTFEVLQAYLIKREFTGKSFVFENSRTGKPFTRGSLLTICHRVGTRAGVPHCHPHRFRHTFAINYLRNGGDVYTLQKVLGHTTMDMVTKYLAISRVDIERNHAKASVVVNWEL